jgi:hypothetical protein
VHAFAADGEDSQLGNGDKHRLQIGGRREHMLERVEDNKRPPASQMLGQGRWRAALGNPNRPRQVGNQQSRILVGRDRQVIHPTLEGNLKFGGYGECEAGLAHSAEAGDADQPPSLDLEHSDQPADLPLAADEGCDRSRHPRNPVLSQWFRTASGIQERSSVGVRQSESSAEPGRRVGVRPSAHSALDVANRAGAHASALGELLLRQPRLLAVASQQPPEREHQLDASRPTTR